MVRQDLLELCTDCSPLSLSHRERLHQPSTQNPTHSARAFVLWQAVIGLSIPIRQSGGNGRAAHRKRHAALPTWHLSTRLVTEEQVAARALYDQSSRFRVSPARYRRILSDHQASRIWNLLHDWGFKSRRLCTRTILRGSKPPSASWTRHVPDPRAAACTCALQDRASRCIG
jgi:hypothetical protein